MAMEIVFMPMPWVSWYPNISSPSLSIKASQKWLNQPTMVKTQNPRNFITDRKRIVMKYIQQKIHHPEYEYHVS